MLRCRHDGGMRRQGRRQADADGQHSAAKYVLERIAGDKWTVGSMIEKATSAESYDPDMSQMMDLENCRAYFVIGNLGFERLAAGKAKTVVDSSKGISVIDGHSHHGEMEADPHVWMSVENMRIVAKI